MLFRSYISNWKRKQIEDRLINAIEANKFNDYAVAYNNQGGTKANKFYMIWLTNYKDKDGIAFKTVYYKYGWPPLKLNEKYHIKEF